MNTQLMIAGYCPVGNYSFEIIYKKYHTFFVHYAEKTMGEELYAEDVVQDVFQHCTFRYKIISLL